MSIISNTKNPTTYGPSSKQHMRGGVVRRLAYDDLKHEYWVCYKVTIDGSSYGYMARSFEPFNDYRLEEIDSEAYDCFRQTLAEKEDDT